MRILMPACILLMITSVSLIPKKNSIGLYLGIAACVLIVVALLITLLVEVPIDNQIKPGQRKPFLSIGRRCVRGGRFITQREHFCR
jgi:hypothetical protein